MKETYFELKAGQHGLLDDGRPYTILSIPSIIMCSNGTMKLGRIQLNIENDFYELTIEDFVNSVATVRDLKIREAKKTNEWTSVDKAMPKGGKPVLVRTEAGYGYDVARYDEYKNQWYSNFLSFDSQITHWMPLPEGPEE